MQARQRMLADVQVRQRMPGRAWEDVGGKQKVPTTTTVMTGTACSRTPYGIRTRAAGVKGRCPRPLNEGGAATSGVTGPQRDSV